MISSLFSLKGKISRMQFALSGFVLFLLKYYLDRLIAGMNSRPWFFTDYFIQPDRMDLGSLDQEDIRFYITLVFFSIPFVYLGINLCIKRLRDIQLPQWLLFIFFLPVINILFFAMLCILPGHTVPKEIDERPAFLSSVIPKSKWGSVLFSIGISVLIAFLFSVFSIDILKEYGWGLFIAIPFFIGFASVLLYSYHHRITLQQSIGIALMGVLAFSGLLLGLALEGFICIAMAAPAGIALSVVGAILGYAVQSVSPKSSFNTITAFVLLVPGLILMESTIDRNPETYELKTSVFIHASSQKVWNHLVEFNKMETPQEFIFKSGIAYPVDAVITGKGKGAVRRCNFTTGSFVEPITVWNEPELLAFDVLKQPRPMTELSFYKHVHAPHLDGYFLSQRGQFHLTKVDENTTLLEGTTWYENKMWPAAYWRLWSDYILHKIHSRVLEHIRKTTERIEN